ncbi:hypothetical protein ACHRV1_16095 [Flavobacterium aquidurense]|uniref:hypothetical protein n=1 Tax=Flavobacterium aquidurense TaxID=362413 RepID=UPI0037572706
MREWINDRFGTNFSEVDLSSVKDFSLIWNVFENVVCQNNFSIARTEEVIKNSLIDSTEFNSYLEYFKNRYVSNGTFTNRFQYLHFRNNDRRNLVEDVLLGNNTKNNDIILALLIIVYRYRNNLFHGIKRIQEIDKQRENFENANGVLKTLLNHFQ